MIKGLATDEPFMTGGGAGRAMPGHPMAGMTPIMTPLASAGFGPRALELLDHQLRPLGMAPLAGGAASPKVIREDGDKPLAPGSPLSIALVSGDFDLSGSGRSLTLREIGSARPSMSSLGACELPMMTGHSHRLSSRQCCQHEDRSPLKIVGIIDTDVSTGVSDGSGPNLTCFRSR